MFEKIGLMILCVGLVCMIEATCGFTQEIKPDAWTIVSLQALDDQVTKPLALNRILGKEVVFYANEIRFGGRRCHVDAFKTQKFDAEILATRLGCAANRLGLMPGDNITELKTGCPLLGLDTIYELPDGRRCFVIEGHVVMMFPVQRVQ